MRKKDFDNLIQAAQEFKLLREKKIKAAKVFNYSLDIKRIRRQLKMSQSEFADFLDIPLKTIINWEQGRTTPTGAAKSLLKIAEKKPRALIVALHKK